MSYHVFKHVYYLENSKTWFMNGVSKEHVKGVWRCLDLKHPLAEDGEPPALTRDLDIVMLNLLSLLQS